MRFSIRDVLWLTVVVGAVLTVWLSQRQILIREREKLSAERNELAVTRRHFEIEKLKAAHAAAYANRVLQSVRERQASLAPPPTAEEVELAKNISQLLGAPQPKPLPPGYGENPNPQ